MFQIVTHDHAAGAGKTVSAVFYFYQYLWGSETKAKKRLLQTLSYLWYNFDQ
jgi:hypothetical protein